MKELDTCEKASMQTKSQTMRGSSRTTQLHLGKMTSKSLSQIH